MDDQKTEAAAQAKLTDMQNAVVELANANAALVTAKAKHEMANADYQKATEVAENVFAIVHQADVANHESSRCFKDGPCILSRC